MVKIGNVELHGLEMGTVSIKDLGNDVPVNERHVQELANSIRAVGQISPLVVWKERQKIIDGFHRAAALGLAGRADATCLFYSCDEETFWNLRILNAVTHRSVSFARVVQWIHTAFGATKWAQQMQASDAFRVSRKGAAFHMVITSEERVELTAWVQEKAQLWNLPERRICSMLRIAQLVDQSLIVQVRDEQKPGVLTQSMLGKIGKNVKGGDLQLQVVSKIHNEKLSLRDVEFLVMQLQKATTERQRQQIINTPLRRTRGRPPLHATLELQRVKVGLMGDALQTLIEYLPGLHAPQAFDPKVSEAIALCALYLGQEDATALEILQHENHGLKEETQRFSVKVARQDETITSYQRQIAEFNRIAARRD